MSTVQTVYFFWKRDAIFTALFPDFEIHCSPRIVNLVNLIFFQRKDNFFNRSLFFRLPKTFRLDLLSRKPST